MLNTRDPEYPFLMLFVRADQALVESNEDRFPLHALEFSWEGFEPSLTCYDSKVEAVSEFDLSRVDFSISRRKTCVGYFNDEGQYVQCPERASVDKYHQCQKCSEEVFLPYQDCLFEPRCEGEICDLDFCRREHVLYVAYYDTRMKIGMSSSRRIARRLIEQGADAYSIIGKMPTRKRAREAEKSISSRLGIPQYVRRGIVLRNLARKVDVAGIEGRFEGLRMTLGEMFQLDLEPLQWLRDYPIELPLAETPRLQESWGRHKGRLVGIKGGIMVYESDGLKALNLADIPARYLSRDL